MVHDPFPFKRRLSLEPLVRYWQHEAVSGDPVREAVAEAVLEQYEATDDLKGSELNPDRVSKHRDVLRSMFRAVLPTAVGEDLVAGAIVPFELRTIYATRRFEELHLLDRFAHATVLNGKIMGATDMMVGKAMNGFHHILDRFYGVKAAFDLPFVVGTDDPETGLPRYYQIEIDRHWFEVELVGDLPALTPDTIRLLLSNPMDMELWLKHLPADRFEFVGLGIFTAVDVTLTQIFSLLRNDLLHPDALRTPERFDEIEGRLKSIMNGVDVRLGLIALDYDQFGELNNARPLGRSLLLSGDGLPECPKKKESHYARVFERHEPVIVDDIDRSEVQTGFEAHLRDLGYRSMAICPLIEGDRLIGLLELASSNPGEIDAQTGIRLMEVVSLFATAMKRAADEREDRVQAVIKRRYTAIHPVVEWRFRRSAIDLMDREAIEEGGEAEAIVFPDVYPLYGLSDIRGSSSHRSDAIRDDLVDQLALALTAVIEASTIQPQPALDEIGYRLGRYIEELKEGVHAGEASDPLRFVQKDFEPLLDQLAALAPEVRARVDAYRQALDPMLRVVYRKRKAFEQSVMMVNDAIAHHIEGQDEEAQKLVPHYFEKYRTDGVDYNIYAGASLTEERRFEPLQLRNLRLWQLMTTAGAAWVASEIRDSLPMPLEVAHLILVQSAPMSIRFRPDEKKFDVDGAYNIRYEIVKKRIDKARVLGTGERLTAPGAIAIVYSQASEAKEYERFLEYLQAAGYLEEGIEWLELEPLQGVQGLRAIRVQVKPSRPHSEVLTEVLPRTVSLSER